MIKRGRFEYGFSLLEVLVAFAITALFLGAVLPATFTSLHRLMDIRLRFSAHSIASSVLERHVAIARFEEGVFDGHQGDFLWQTTIEHQKSDFGSPSPVALRQVRVKVSTKGGDQIIALSTYQLGANQ